MYSSVFLIASCLAGASAFAPSATSRSSTTTSQLQMADFSKEIGAQMPLGFWDPLGFMKGGDQALFDSFREIEVKHGRVAMMAILGHIVTSKGDRMPGLEDCKVGLTGLSSVPQTVYAQLFATVLILEIGYGSRKDEIEKIHLEKSKWSAETIAKKKAVELNNGRAAQMGILGLMTHELIDGNPYVLNSLLGAPVPFN
jgi:Chlorophyll A-B binding protein